MDATKIIKLLRYACINGNVSNVKTLLDNGSDIMLKDNIGWNAIDVARNENNVEILKVFDTFLRYSSPTC